MEYEQIADLGFEKIEPNELPDKFITAYDIEQDFKRQFGLKE